MSLQKKYTSTIIRQACQKALTEHQYSYFYIVKMTEMIQAQKEHQPEIPFLQEHEIIRPLKDYQQIITKGDTKWMP